MTRRFRRLSAVAAVLLLFVAACGSDDSNDAGNATGDDTTSEGAQTLVVGVDAKAADFPMAALAYFPNAVTAHPGDTVEFEGVWTGEPHTVTFGTLVDEGIAAADPTSETEPEQLAQIPAPLPDGPGDAIQTASQPCYAETAEDIPTDGAACANQTQEAFSGTTALYSSGILFEGDTYSVALADDLAPGTYTFFCELHRAGMTGTVTVVAADDDADSADDVAAARAAAEDELSAALAPVAAAAETGSIPGLFEGGPGQVLAGSGSEDNPEGLVVSFGPKDVTVAAGESVTWTVIGPHTVSFGATEEQRAAIVRAPDGSVHLNPDAFAPTDGDGQPPPTDNPPGPPIPIDGGTYDGTGFHNSGAIISFPPQLYTYSVEFSAPGTYEYFCLIHPEMQGTVTVT